MLLLSCCQGRHCLVIGPPNMSLPIKVHGPDIKYTDIFIYEFSRYQILLKNLCCWLEETVTQFGASLKTRLAHFPYRAKGLRAEPIAPHPVENKYTLLQEIRQSDPSSWLVFLASLVSHPFAPCPLHKELLVSHQFLPFKEKRLWNYMFIGW